MNRLRSDEHIMTRAARDALGEDIARLQKERAEFHQIIVDLFAPEHFDGCLFKNDSRMPCQCGNAGRIRRYFAAVERAKAVVVGHDYLNDFRDDDNDD
jgi:hypothetical protein